MTTEAIFDPKYNIVAVDPSDDSFVQIPGKAFQAPSSSDTFAKFKFIPNFNTVTVHPDGGQPKPPTGEYVVGMCVDSRNKMDWLQAESSITFRPTNAHISERYYKDNNQQTINKKYDKYIECTDFTETSDSARITQYNYGWVRFKWQEMKNDGIRFPADKNPEWPRQDNKLFLSFDVEIHRTSIPSTYLSGDQPTYLSAGPYNAPVIIPVRLNITELWDIGRGA